MTKPASIPHYAYFRAIPWCAPLFSDPLLQIRLNDNIKPKPDTEDSFFAETLNTPLTVHATLTFAALPTDPAPMPVRENRTLFALGSGLNGHAHAAHGGLLGCLFDEAMSLLIRANKDEQPREMPDPSTWTAYMKVDYRKIVQTPQVVMVRSWLRQSVGRKYYIDASLEDEHGTILAQGEALWLASKPIQGTAKL